MTRWLFALVVLSVAVMRLDPSGYGWAGLAGLALACLSIGLRIRSGLKRRAALRTVEGLRALHPAEFEAEVGRWLRRDGWRVEHCGRSGDGGIDLVARRRRETLAVQCKRYAESAAVSAAQVRDLYGAAVADGATAAVLVTTGRVSGPAVSWAEALPPGPALAFHDANCLARLARGCARVA